jgi:hypothetical protein
MYDPSPPPRFLSPSPPCTTTPVYQLRTMRLLLLFTLLGAAVAYNVNFLLNNQFEYREWPQTNLFYLAYAIWSDSPTQIFVAQGSYCDSSRSSPSTYLTSCSRTTAASGFKKCTQYTSQAPMCLYITCKSTSGCSISFNAMGYANNPGSNALDYIESDSASPSVTPTRTSTKSASSSPTSTNSITASPTRTPSITPSPTGTPSITPTPSNTPLVTPSAGGTVLRLSFIFSNASAAFNAEMQRTIMAAAAVALDVPPASIGWLGTTNPAAPGISRLLQAGGTRVQLSVAPIALTASAAVQAAVAANSNSLPAAVSSVLSANFNSALATQQNAAALATALGYGSTAAMQSSLSLDPSIPVSAVVMSATPSPSPPPSTSPSPSPLPPPPGPSQLPALIGGIVGAAAVGLYFFIVSIVACCVKCTCCCQHALCNDHYQTRSIWCCCCTTRSAKQVHLPNPGGNVVIRNV